MSAQAPPDERLRVMIETDAPGGDPDDLASLVRFFCYLNEWEVEGLFGTRPAEKARENEDGKACLLRFIGAYEEAWPLLKTHDARFPAPEALRAVTYGSFAGTEARDAVIRAGNRDDPRRIWYVNWGTNDGTKTAMSQAFDYVKETRSEADYRKFVDRFCFSRDAGHVGKHSEFLHFWVDTRDPNKWYHRFAPLTAEAGGFDIKADVKTGHGKLGSFYTTQKEGDTPGFLFLVPTGLSDPLHPEWGSWAGRFSPRVDRKRGTKKREGFFEAAAEDEVDGVKGRDQTLERWAVHLQNDFKARMDWFVKPYAEANHPPLVMLNGRRGSAPVTIQAVVDSVVKFNAGGSSDPDGDRMEIRWFVYPEAGTYQGKAEVFNVENAEGGLNMPKDAAGKTIHVILQITDQGEPPLTRYRRLVIEGKGE